MIGFRKAQPQIFWGSPQLAALDHAICEFIAPSHWTREKTLSVVRELRAGKSTAQVCADNGDVTAETANKLKRAVGANTVRAIIQCRTGSIAVEFAILAPIALLLALGALQLGMGMFFQQRINFGAESAARCGAIEAAGCGSLDAVASYAVDRSALGSASYTASVQACGLQVTGSVVLDWIHYPGVPDPLTLSGTACYPLASQQAPVTVAQLPGCSGDGGANSGLQAGQVRTQWVIDAMPGSPGDPVAGGGTKLVQVACGGSTSNWVID